MTPQEEQLLNSLIERVNQTQLQEKDPDAEALLNQKLGPNPDALYMLAQTVLVQNIALDQAKAQVSQLQQQVQQFQQHPQKAHTTSFLGRLLGEHDPAPQQPQQQAPAPAYQPVPQYAPPAQPYPQYSQPPYQQTQYVPVGGQPSFLRGAMQTAAGVAAGALAFEGVESILNGFGHGFGQGGYGFGGPGYGIGGFGMGERPVGETVINNYYDDPDRGVASGEHHQQDQGAQSNDSGSNPRDNDSSDNLRGFDQNAGSAGDQDTSAFADASNLDDQSSLDDQNVDDGSGYDDSGSFDDSGGSFDDGGGGF
ncbi:MAG: DUF2076 domain-containing protein [Terracidiphilus sp.]